MSVAPLHLVPLSPPPSSVPSVALWLNSSPRGPMMNIRLAPLIALCLMPTIACAQTTNPLADGGNSPSGYDMAPETRPEVVQAASAAIGHQIPPGPFQPSWD